MTITPEDLAQMREYVTGLHPGDAALSKGAALRLLDAVAEAWDEGHSWGWSDAQDAHDVRQAMDRADWPLNTTNPYRQEQNNE